MKKTAAASLLPGLFLSFALPLLADDARLRRPPIDETALEQGMPHGVPSAHPRNTVIYSGTTVGGPSWVRPFSTCDGLTGLGPMTYQVQPFYVDSNGAYDIASIQDGGWNGYLLLYQNGFDPAHPLANCLTGNDDGWGGIGTSQISGVALFAGSQYFLVVTAFSAGEEGTYQVNLSGPGSITLGALGGLADLAITKTGEVPIAGGSYFYELLIENRGPDTATGVEVTDHLPAGLTYESDTCGGNVSMPVPGSTVWQWTLDELAAPASANCRLQVSLVGLNCQAVSNTARIAGDQVDPNFGNNSSTASNFEEAVADGGFEAGSPNPSWTESSTNFGTPLCTVAGCGTGLGTGPHSGQWWAWFGGIAAPEVGSVSQSLTIPFGAPTLSFFFEAPSCGNATDFVRAQIDGITVWEATGAHPQCNLVGYVEQQANIFPFADGGFHTLTFTSSISGTPSLSSFFIDDISILEPECALPGVPTNTSFDIAVPTLSEVAMAVMALLMAACAFVELRRRF